MLLTWLTSLAAIALAAPPQQVYHLKESHVVPPAFVREGDASAHDTIRLELVLAQHRLTELEQHLSEISDPTHARYGQHLTKAEVDELAQPHSDAMVQVQQWLEKSTDLTYSVEGNVVSIATSIAHAEALLDTKFGVYRHVDGSRLTRAPEWKLPRHLHQHIVTIQPTTSFMRSAPQVQAWSGGAPHDISMLEERNLDVRPAVKQACNASAITPHCLRTLYGTVNYEPQATGVNRLGVTNFRNQVDLRSDIRKFLRRYRPAAAAAADEFDLISVNGGTVSQAPLNASQLRIGLGAEGDLDVEYLLSVGWPTPLTSWSVAGAPPFIPDADSKNYTEIEPYLAWLKYTLKQDDIPQVISNSYADDEQTIPPAYAKAVCAKFAQLAARGVTFLTGSGDGGVGGVMPNGTCLSNKDNSTRQFVPLFPATCPYVTVVGGTSGIPEMAALGVADFASGGGFSNYFERPAFQKPTVDGYLTTLGDAFTGLYNTSGRAYPDIAAYSTKYVQIYNGTQRLVEGTSAATPTMAAVISLVNDALITAGKPVLGWMNPWLYEHGGKHGFRDVTDGSARGCNVTGFPAVKGWDAVTGFGSPRFEKLLKAAGLDPSSCGGYHDA